MSQFLDKIFEWDKGTRFIRDLLFLLLFVWQSASYGYFENMDRFPEGTHMWRKCDGASMAQNYAQKELPLLEPQLHQLFEGSGKAVGEFPVFYYLIGKTYQVFGFSNEIFRWWWWGLLALGFYLLFQWFYLKTKSTIVSVLLNIFCFTPPILVYYGIEFLPDTVALALSFGGLYFYEKWRKHPSKWSVSLGVLFFSLAMLTKVSAGILLVAIASYEIISFQKGKFWNTIKVLLPWAVPFAVTLIWVQYAAWYNAQSGNVYFLLDTVPYWTLSEDQIIGVKTNFMEFWYNELLAYKSLWLLTVPFFALGLLWYKKLQKETVSLVVYALLTGSFVLLFFERFGHHDYYIICLYGGLPLIAAYSVSLIKTMFSSKLMLVIIVVALIPFVAQNVSSAQIIAETRTHTWTFYNKLDNNLTQIEPWLNKNGITKEVPVLSVFDPSPNVSLYYMNRKGLSNIYNQELSEEFIQHAKSIGIKHVLVHSEGLRTERERELYCRDTVSSIGNIHLFKLN